MIDYSYRGAYTKEFEKMLEDYIGAYVVCTNTGTAALHLSLILSGVNNQDYVICPAITYVATANSIMYTQAKIVFADVKDDLTIDFEKTEKYLKYFKKIIKYIMPVHVLGTLCDIEKLKYIAKKYKLTVIEDACQALGSFYNGNHAGTFGKFGAISFNGNKIITTGGGGALITKSKKDKERAIHFSTVCKVLTKKQCYHDNIGYNYRMPALNAKMGIEQLTNSQRLKELKEKSKTNKIVNNEWKKIDGEGESIWTPLHLLNMYKKMYKMDCSNAEKIGKTVRIK